MNKSQVLKQRSITGLFFGMVILALLLSGKLGAMLLGVAIAILGCYEYVRMIFPKNVRKLSLAWLTTAASIIFTLSLLPQSGFYHSLVIVSMLALVVGIINLFFSFINHKKVFVAVVFFYVGLPMALFLSYIWNTEVYQATLWIGVIVLIWMSDSFAYLIGSNIGKRKLFERISPKKSWEGFIGAGLLTLMFAYLISHFYDASGRSVPGLSPSHPTLFWVCMASIVWIIGTLGDLVESSIKRKFDIKDSGKLLPGHGGILDRFDSFIYILPFVLFLLLHFSQ